MSGPKYKNYQEFYANYLGGWSFKDGDQILTIKDVLEQEVRTKDNGTETRLTVIFEETELPLILNRTNADMIARVTGASYTGDWIGKKIKVGSSKVKAFGDVWDAVRIRDEKITAASMEKATAQQLKKILDMVDVGAINQQNLLKYYKIEQLNQLSRQQAMEIIRSKTGEVIE